MHAPRCAVPCAVREPAWRFSGDSDAPLYKSPKKELLRCSSDGLADGVDDASEHMRELEELELSDAASSACSTAGGKSRADTSGLMLEAQLAGGLDTGAWPASAGAARL